ncbi:MAG TPA: hypothetical protein PLO53_12295 [Candidatus Hydrogenedentes bacterium]|nr:hypothetical protein [Candidatus Hydrogenedentota bacterium]
MPEKRRPGGNTGVWWRLIQTAARAGEDMFVAPDARSVHRGNRRAPRTEVFRPCLVGRPGGDPDREIWEGIVLDLNRYGFRIRSFAPFVEGDLVTVQLMRDEEFKYPLSGVLTVRVVRRAEAGGGLMDFGMELVVEPLSPTSRSGRGIRPAPPPSLSRPGTRMHLADYINNKGRGSKNR